MQRPEGFRCPGSGFGYPHGKDKRRERHKRAIERAKAGVATPPPGKSKDAS